MLSFLTLIAMLHRIRGCDNESVHATHNQDRSSTGCTDITTADGREWQDLAGHPCSDYDDRVCEQYGSDTRLANFDMTGNVACCKCNGGSGHAAPTQTTVTTTTITTTTRTTTTLTAMTTVTTAMTPRTTASVSLTCDSGWRSVDGTSCAHYGQFKYCTWKATPGEGWEDEWGPLENWVSPGKAWAEVCPECGCGGCRSDGDCDENYICATGKCVEKERCPTSHPYAYSEERYGFGTFCCANAFEKKDHPFPSDTCNGKHISLTSTCCQEYFAIPCTNPPCVNAIFAEKCTNGGPQCPSQSDRLCDSWAAQGKCDDRRLDHKVRTCCKKSCFHCKGCAMREFDHQCARDDSCIWSEMRQECREKVYCEDHIQNGDEEGVDCGGSCPLPCTCLWRHSNGCGASVVLAPYYNQNCDVLIPSNAAGYCDCGNGYDHMNSVRCVHEPFTCRTVCEAVRCMDGFDTTCSACKQDGETCIVPGCLNEVYPTPGCGMLFGSCDAQRRCRAWPGEGNWSPSSARGSSDDYCRDFYTSCAEMIDWCHVQKFAAGCPRTCKTCNPNYSTPMLALQRESFDASITRTSPDFPEVTVFDDESLVPPSDGLRYSDFLNDAARNPFGFGIFNPVHNTIAGMHYILPTRPPVTQIGRISYIR
eukprot:GEMP01013527.1.p1 GENE.GEMP01013527.1~~GEMP01013527.1.p1  ORF type:complete len:654 (+),score=77.28 GEMP01013527.1:22-1962(+)